MSAAVVEARGGPIVRLACALVSWLVRAWRATLRVRVVTHPALQADTRPRVLCLRHGASTTLLAAPPTRPTTALVSRSRDGELGAALLGRLGLGVVRGSTSRGGASGLRALVRVLRAGRDAAIAVDGPRGPRGRVAPGAIAAARLGGGVLVPVRAHARWAIRLGTWDAHVVPLPFCQVEISLGAPLCARSATPTALAEALEKSFKNGTLALQGPDARSACLPPPSGGTVPG